jgi:hypothetical protein
MLKVLELPQIDKLLPEIDRAHRMVESPGISEEAKLHTMWALMQNLEKLNSDVARNYRIETELQLQAAINRLTEKISESSDLSQEEKIRQLKEIIAQIQAMESEKNEAHRRTRLTELGAAHAARRLIEEINKADRLSQEEKIKEIRELLEKTQVRESELIREDTKRRSVIELEAASALRDMLQETLQRKDLSDEEKAKELESFLREAKNMKSKEMERMIGAEKFAFDLQQFLKKEGLLPEGAAEFVLKMNECSINGKKLPKNIHDRIMKLCKESLRETFNKNTKIILQLNEDHQ